MAHIRYKKGFKYQLDRDYSVKIALRPKKKINTRFIVIDTDGELLIRAGYAWDGPSGPTIDTPNFMRGSLVHDALYQLMRYGLLRISKRRIADQVLQVICAEDGMSKIRRWWVDVGLKIGGGAAADPENLKPVYTAPRVKA